MLQNHQSMPSVSSDLWRLLRRSWPVLFLAISGFLLLGAFSFNDFQVGGFTDDATYITLARSLADGNGFTLANNPVPVRETTFPPGYPLLLVPLAFLWPDNFLPMQVASFIATLTSICIFWLIAEDRTVIHCSPISRAAAVILFAIHPFIVGASSMVMSEPVFTMLSLAVIAAVWRYEKTTRWRWPMAFLLAALLNMTIAVRTIGFSLTIASFFYLLVLRREVRESILLGAMWLITFIPLLFHNFQSGGGVLSPGYIGQTATGSTLWDKLVQVGTNFSQYMSARLPYLLVPVPQIAIFASLALGVILVLLMLIGAKKLTRQGQLILVYLTIFFIGILLFWNPSVGSTQSRFLIPIIPWMLLLVIAGFERLLEFANKWLHQRIPNQAPKFAIVLMIVVIALLYLGRNAQAAISPIRFRMTDLSVGTSWIAANAPADVIVVSQDPVPMSLYTERYTVSYPNVTGDALLKSLVLADVDYLVVAPRLAPERSVELDDFGREVAYQIQHHPEYFKLVFHDGSMNVAVYEMVK